MTIEYFLADTSGNRTIFVTTPTRRKDYARVAVFLLEKCEPRGEQVAFILADAPPDCDGAFEMCGLEFCCNATRAFGYLIACKSLLPGFPSGKAHLRISTSGMHAPLLVAVDLPGESASVSLPAPKILDSFPFSWNGSVFQVAPVEMDGILHLILEDFPREKALVDALVDEGMRRWNPPALGMLFYETGSRQMTPAVYVRDVSTLYWEGSCGSGTAALAWVLASRQNNPEYDCAVVQPQGVLQSHVSKNGPCGSVSVGGPVLLEGPYAVEML